MTFFTDRDLGNIFPDTLQQAGIKVEKHAKHFAHDTPDDIWLPEVGRRGWVAISRNYRIYYQPNERDAMMRAGTGLFLVIGPGATFRELAENFVACIHKIERFLETHYPPFIARVYLPPSEKTRRGSRKSGKVELWLSYDEWRRKVGGE